MTELSVPVSVPLNVPVISVVLITYNHEKYIAEAIQSTLNQTYRDFELIVVDDGSQDRTGEIVRSCQDPRVRYHVQRNQGPSAALNQGVAMSRGRYIAFLSGDDVHCENRLAVQFETAEAQGKKVLFSHVSYIGEEGQAVDCPSWLLDCFNTDVGDQAAVLRRLFEEGNFLSAPTAFIERQLLTEIAEDRPGPFHPALMQFQDFALWIELAKKVEFLILKEPLVKYRVRGQLGNLSAPRVDVLRRVDIEYSILIQEFFMGMEDDLFISAFQHRLVQRQFDHPLQRRVEEVFLYLSSDVANVRIHGIFRIAELLQNREAVEVLRKYYDFEAIQFSKQLTHERLFSNIHSSSSLYLNMGRGFSEKDRLKIKGKTVFGSFTFSFDLSHYPHVHEVRWDPVEGEFCEIELKEVCLIELDGTKVSLINNEVCHNGEKVGTSLWRFLTSDPMLVFPVNRQVRSMEIVGQGRIVTSQDLCDQINQLKAVQDHLKHQLHLKRSLLEKIVGRLRRLMKG